ncbi:aldo/keto reductase [Microvirga aerilata]|uniref:Aldo/keto reductase n=1 Tax=Microvirga aerilata TaxID=670292 RepID=A0A937CW39_9HYPH|nr:aldo/keto reductase [Microvirga aerilata]MBL0402808.1 aldo/keto reductase [Microvirga aerilata]
MDRAGSQVARSFPTRSGRSLSFTELGFGTAPLGNLYRAIDESAAQETLQTAWSVGCRYFDTAPLYGLGLSETRLNPFLRGRPRDSYVLSTKVGRLLRACPPEQRTGIGKFFGTPARQEVYDYSYDGVMRSIEDSLERLGVDRIDILFCHDVDVFTHGSKEASDRRIGEFMQGGYRALAALRDQGVIAAIGAGVNEWQVCERMAREGDFDLFLLAGRYTLLEQEALETFLPYCTERGIGIVLGGPYNSGILATGPKPGAFYNYDPAPPEILERVGRIEKVCSAHGVRLIEAALRFPLGHQAVVSVVPGAQTAEEVHRNAEIIQARIPSGLWEDLKSEGLLRQDAPVPA